MPDKEEIPFELAFHNLRSEAKDIAEVVRKANIKATLSFIVALIVLFMATLIPVRYFFFNELPYISCIILACDVVAAYTCYAFLGKLFLGSKKHFVKLVSLSNKFKYATDAMDIIEEKQLEKKAYEKDIEKTEDNLIRACESLIAEYKK